MIGSMFWELASRIIYESPVLIVYVVGIVLSIRSSRQNGRRYRLTLISFILFAFVSVGGTLILAYVFERHGGSSGNTDQLKVYVDLLEIVSIVLETGAWVLLLIALFSRLTTHNNLEHLDGSSTTGAIDIPKDGRRLAAGVVVAITILLAAVISVVLFRWDLLLVGKEDYHECSTSSDYYPCVPCTDGVDWTDTPSSIASSLAACLESRPFDVEHARAYHLVPERATIVLHLQQMVEHFDLMQHRIELRRVDDRWIVDWAGIRYQCWENYSSDYWPWTTERCRYNLLD